MIMLGLGAGQGVLGYMQGRDQAKVAESNAAQARQGQKYEEEVKKTNLAVIEGERMMAKEQQEYVNAAALGAAQAALGGSGAMGGSGTSLEVLSEQAALGINEVQNINAKFSKERSGAINSGNMAIYNLQRQESQYLQQARDAKRMAVMNLISGVGMGMMGAHQVDNTFFKNMFAESPGSTALTVGMKPLTPPMNVWQGGVSQGSWSWGGGFNPNMSVKPPWAY